MDSNSAKLAMVPDREDRSGWISLPRRERLWLMEGKKCHWCGCETLLIQDNAPNQATIEHVIPTGRGGTNAPDNLVSACYACNQRRNDEDNRSKGKANYYRHVALSGDEKRSLMEGIDKVRRERQAIDVVKEQRDQAQKRIVELERELKTYRAVVIELELQAKNITVTRLIRRKLASWING